MKARRRGKPGAGGKAKIMALVERGGHSRAIKVADLTNETMQRILLEHVDRKSRLMTDEDTAPSIGLLFAKHETVEHSAKEYARGDVSTNTIEGYFSVFSAVCAILISTVQRNTCSAIVMSSTSATTLALCWASTT